MEAEKVTYRIGILFMVLIILLGGCQVNKDETSTNPSEIDKDGLPEVRAFNDSFTREFLQSTEETREGYYPFVSGTEQFKMDFPAEGVIGQKAYFIKEERYEEFPIHIKTETGSKVRINYYSDDRKELLKENLNAFKKRLGYDGDFEKLKGDKQSLNYAHYERNGFRTYVGYVLNERESGGIELTYKIDCRDEKEEICKENRQSDKKRAVKWMESVQFINGDEGEDHE